MMRLEEVYYSINTAIIEFEYKHGKQPDCIFVSEPLIKYIQEREILMSNYNPNSADDKNIICNCCGIKVITYKHSEPEYYLAEGPGMFRRYYNDEDVVLYTED